MTEMVTSGSMSGEGKRSDGLLGEGGHERRCLLQAPPVLYATALLLDSTNLVQRLLYRPHALDEFNRPVVERRSWPAIDPMLWVTRSDDRRS